MEQKNAGVTKRWEHDVWDERTHLIRFAEEHPKAQPQDYIKRLYQSEFGGGHMIADEEESLSLLKKEIAGLTEKQQRRQFFEQFCGDFCCMNLSVSREAPPELINRLFVASSKQVPLGAAFRFGEKLRVLLALCSERSDLFLFSKDELETYVQEYLDAGMPLLRHSDAYRKAYTPAYRVVRKEFAQLLPLYIAMERCLKEKGRVNLAIDGDSAAGKTETARWIGLVYDCNIFHADDFFLPKELRTPERLREPGGNMDRVRFQNEICVPVREGKPFSYRPFNCNTMRQDAPVSVEPKKINVFEGSYTMHPELRDFYDLSVFLSIDPTQQEARILARNGAFMLRSYVERWIPMEKRYHEAMKVKEACDLVF